MDPTNRAELFAFKVALYDISNKLTASDIEKIKFMLSDFLPRQQLERAKSGFDLLCLMASRKDLLSFNDRSFLEEVLREVGKSDLVSRSFSKATSRNTVLNPAHFQVSQHQRPKLLQIKRLLGEIADNLSTENVKDLCMFFVGICESINYRNVHDIKSAEQLFTMLQESLVIGIGQLHPLQQVLNLIGRIDLASIIEAFNAGTWQSFHSHPSLPTPEEHHGAEEPRVFAGHTSLDASISSQTAELETDSGRSAPHYLLNKQETKIRSPVQIERGKEEELLRALQEKTEEVKTLGDNVSKLQEVLGNSDVPLYGMKQNPHGLALVFVNGRFASNTPLNFTLKNRDGAVKDSDCFFQTFSHLGYTVRPYYDLSAAEMETKIIETSALDHSEFDSFVCCVSSHGNQEGIYGSDCVILNRKVFIDKMKSCVSLRGKPKMFFFQACRVPLVQADSDSPQHSSSNQPATLHPDSDILIANASTEGNAAYTSPQTGSWFANALKMKLTNPQLPYVRTLQQILEEVTDLVSKTDGQLPNGERVNQCVEVTTRMRKGVKFF